MDYFKALFTLGNVINEKIKFLEDLHILHIWRNGKHINIDLVYNSIGYHKLVVTNGFNHYLEGFL